MLVLSRTPQESVIVSGLEGSCLITVLQVQGSQARLLISHSAASKPGVLDSWTTEIVLGATVQICEATQVKLLDVREDKVRIGINVSPETSVHRLEVWNAMQRENRRSWPDEEDGPAGSRVPR